MVGPSRIFFFLFCTPFVLSRTQLPRNAMRCPPVAVATAFATVVWSWWFYVKKKKKIPIERHISSMVDGAARYGSTRRVHHNCGDHRGFEAHASRKRFCVSIPRPITAENKLCLQSSRVDEFSLCVCARCDEVANPRFKKAQGLKQTHEQATGPLDVVGSGRPMRRGI